MSGPSPTLRSALLRRQGARALAFLVLLLVLLGAGDGVRAHVAENFAVPTTSMAPTVRPGDQVLVDKLTTGVHRGDVVVFDGAGSFDTGATARTYLKRVIGLPGDVVACCDSRGRVSVNQVSLPEPYVRDADTTPFGPIQVTAGHLFVLGDHRSDSLDSRVRGTVPAERVLGRAVAVIWPLTHAHVLSAR